MTSCAWCELDVDARDRQSIRLSNSQPPWTPRAAFGVAREVAAIGSAFTAAVRAATAEEPQITLWFHRPCWREFLALLRGE